MGLRAPGAVCCDGFLLPRADHSAAQFDGALPRGIERKDMATQLEQDITAIVAEVAEIDEKELWDNRAKDFLDDLEIDSMLGLEIVASIEKKYRIEIEEEELLDITSLNATIELVQRLLDKDAA
jgi:acyl carrier protein